MRTLAVHREIAARAKPFGIRTIAVSRTLKSDGIADESCTLNELDQALVRADIVVLSLALTPQTRHLLNEESLTWLKPTCRIVNTARGGVMDEAALARALEQGRVAGAALDVFAVEPLPADHPLTRAPNTLLTPHVAAATREALDRMALDAAQGILDVLQGRPPRYCVT